MPYVLYNYFATLHNSHVFYAAVGVSSHQWHELSTLTKYRYHMKEQYNIEHRKPIWIALSEFYLDTELEDSDFERIALIIIDSPYTFKE